ncbi:hypothetical protein F2Q68_00007512 [Brassica cretica]|uniref:Uncharacterized protein n=1 Tax=Brassica cretica TaxID=69181 RepID=A0A8S9KZK7_BRACR|nr:hypothetical protein F2Q68_00007512 [Brassica cretica]
MEDEGMDINIEAENETEEGEGAESALDEYAETSSRKRMSFCLKLSHHEHLFCIVGVEFNKKCYWCCRFEVFHLEQRLQSLENKAATPRKPFHV